MLDRLETAFADQKDFLTDVSHELRTPITVIRGHLETLGDSPRRARGGDRGDPGRARPDEPLRRRPAAADQGAAARLPAPGPLDLDLFTHDLFAKARSLGDRDWRLDGTGVGILSRRQQRLTQAVMNLADNAVRHTGDGRTDLARQLADRRPGPPLGPRRGPGVDAADRERIFDRYRALGQRSRRGDGAGLGLSIVRAIAEAHGGRVELDSQPGPRRDLHDRLPAATRP